MDIFCIGGSSGIGREVIKILSHEGHTLHVASRSAKDLLELPNVTHFEYDIETTQGILPEIDTLNGFLYLPGTMTLKPFPGLPIEQFIKDFMINFAGSLTPLQKYLTPLQKGRGSVVFLSSVAASTGFPFHTSIASAKGAIEGFVKAFAAEFAPTIRCNCIAPSLTDTPLSSSILTSEEKKEILGKRHPLQRIGSPVDIAEAISFLLSEKSSWMTGQVIHVDGGISSLRI